MEKGHVRIRYETLGEEDNETVFLLNGGFMSLDSWSYIPHLLSKDYHVVLHDMRCQGGSSCSEDLCFEMHVKDILDLMDHLGLESAHIVGTSYGGIVGIFVALENPECVDSLSVVASPSDISGGAYTRVKSWKKGAESGDPEKFILSWFNDIYSEDFIRKNPELLERTIERYSEMDFDLGSVVTLFDCLLSLSEQPLTPRLNEIGVPTLVVTASDSVTKELAEEIHQGIENSLHVEIPHSGHAIVVEKPEELALTLLGFLRVTSYD